MMFTDRANDLTPSATVELNATVGELLRKGVDVIKLNIGEPDFGTPDNIREAAKAAIDANFTKYTAVPGIAELRNAISRKLKRDNHIDYRPDEICVSTGAKQALFNALLAIAQPGDEIIIPTPCWVSYEEMVKICGARAVPVPASEKEESKFELDLQAIEKATTTRTKGIIINTPNNPTGVIYREDSLRALAALALRHGFFVLSDEVYEKLTYDGQSSFSIASISKEVRDHCITVNGFSKSYAMTGWRIGYAAADRSVISRIVGLQGHITSATSSISQKAALEALEGPQESVELMRREFEKRRCFLFDRLSRMRGVSCANAKGAFYLLPDVSSYYGRRHGSREIQNSVDLAAYLLEEAHIAVVPGEAFRAPRNIRVSYSNSLAKLALGMDRMEAALARLR